MEVRIFKMFESIKNKLPDKECGLLFAFGIKNFIFLVFFNNRVITNSMIKRHTIYMFKAFIKGESVFYNC